VFLAFFGGKNQTFGIPAICALFPGATKGQIRPHLAKKRPFSGRKLQPVAANCA
jgi:hypothetical protein